MGKRTKTEKSICSSPILKLYFLPSSFNFFSTYRCPERNILSSFVYNKENGTADATLYSMFKFPDSNRVHFQCDILVCKDECDQMICDLPSTQNSNETSRGPLAQARAFEPRADALLQPAEDGALMASTSVFVVEPGSPIGKTDFWRQNSNLLIFFPSIFEFFRAKKRRN